MRGEIFGLDAAISIGRKNIGGTVFRNDFTSKNSANEADAKNLTENNTASYQDRRVEGIPNVIVEINHRLIVYERS